jgi:hypothetical protein
VSESKYLKANQLRVGATYLRDGGDKVKVTDVITDSNGDLLVYFASDSEPHRTLIHCYDCFTYTPFIELKTEVVGPSESLYDPYEEYDTKYSTDW